MKFWKAQEEWEDEIAIFSLKVFLTKIMMKFLIYKRKWNK